MDKALLNDEVVKALKHEFDSSLVNPVEMELFVDSSMYSDIMEKLTSEVATMSDKISFNRYTNEDDKTKEMGVEYYPTTVFYKNGREFARFVGVPFEQMFSVFAFGILLAGSNKYCIPEDSDDYSKIATFQMDSYISVFVSESCEYCMPAASTVMRIAEANPKIKAEVVMASLYRSLANKYSIEAVPTTVLDHDPEKKFVGAYSESLYIDKISKIYLNQSPEIIMLDEETEESDQEQEE